ncbi:hypothetical protein Efla_000520 [Eimeria flavescens]
MGYGKGFTVTCRKKGEIEAYIFFQAQGIEAPKDWGLTGTRTSRGTGVLRALTRGDNSEPEEWLGLEQELTQGLRSRTVEQLHRRSGNAVGHSGAVDQELPLLAGTRARRVRSRVRGNSDPGNDVTRLEPTLGEVPGDRGVKPEYMEASGHNKIHLGALRSRSREVVRLPFSKVKRARQRSTKSGCRSGRRECPESQVEQQSAFVTSREADREDGRESGEALIEPGEAAREVTQLDIRCSPLATQTAAYIARNELTVASQVTTAAWVEATLARKDALRRRHHLTLSPSQLPEHLGSSNPTPLHRDLRYPPAAREPQNATTKGEPTYF